MEINNMMDIIDSRDIIGRIEELEELIAGESTNEGFLEWCTEYDDLKSLEEQCKGYVPDWEDGVSLVHEEYFEQYMDNMVKAWYNIPDMPITIDYDELKQDYTKVDFNGVTYFVR